MERIAVAAALIKNIIGPSDESIANMHKWVISAVEKGLN